jgi:hypothetical protein
MLTYTSGRNLFGKLTNNEESANLTLGDTLINESIRAIVRSKAWPFLYRTRTSTTTASTQFYNLYHDVEQVLAVTITVSGTVYHVKAAPSREFWNKLNEYSNSSTFPEWYYVFNGQVGFYPTPSASSNTITVAYKRRIFDLSLADYTTGTITSIANAATTVTGSGTTWTTKMAGRYMRITDSDVANAGDGNWYEISSVTSATVLELKPVYQGAAIAAAAVVYTIGQVSVLPEQYQELPIFRACQIYFTSVQPEPTRAKMYAEMVAAGMNDMKQELSSTDASPVIEDTGRSRLNPNLFLTAT